MQEGIRLRPILGGFMVEKTFVSGETTTVSCTYMTGTAYCLNCGDELHEHVDNKCLFMPTEFALAAR